MKNIQKSDDGYYYIKSTNGPLQKFEKLEGTRREVWNGVAFKTSSGLTRKNFVRNSRHHIVSRKKHLSNKKQNNLIDGGYDGEKGKRKLEKYHKRKYNGSPDLVETIMGDKSDVPKRTLVNPKSVKKYNDTGKKPHNKSKRDFFFFEKK